MTQVATSIYTYNNETGEVEYDLQLTDGVNEEDSDFIAEVTTAIIGVMDAFVEKAVEHGGGNFVAQQLLSKPIFVIGITADYLFKLKEEQAANGDQGLSDNFAAAGKAAGEFLVATMLTSALLPASAGIFSTVSVGLIAGYIANEVFETNIMGATSPEDALGYLIREFDGDDLSQLGDELYLVSSEGAELAVQTAKSALNSLVSSVASIGSDFQTILNTLLSAEQSNIPRRVDPLTLDLDNDGIELVNVNSSTAFFDLDVTADLDANGNPTGTYTSDGVKEQVGWVSSDDGLLTLDRNGNGTVDNILELFGQTNKTGTEELREYDLNNAAEANGISDGKIDSSDAIFSQLKIWQDLNQNGISEASELKSLSDLNITSINVSPNSLTPSNQINNGNLVISEGSYLKSDGTTGTYANLDLAVNQSNSSSYTYTDSEGNVIGDYNLNLEVLSLPMIRGYGDLKALPIAASSNTNLLNALKELTSLAPQNFKDIDSLVENILTSWAQTDSIDSSLMRGSFSSQKLSTLEAFRGEEYTTVVNGVELHDVQNWQLVQVQSAWSQLVDSVKEKLLIQSTFKDVFTKTVTIETTETLTNEDGLERRSLKPFEEWQNGRQNASRFE